MGSPITILMWLGVIALPFVVFAFVYIAVLLAVYFIEKIKTADAEAQYYAESAWQQKAAPHREAFERFREKIPEGMAGVLSLDNNRAMLKPVLDSIVKDTSVPTPYIDPGRYYIVDRQSGANLKTIDVDEGNVVILVSVVDGLPLFSHKTISPGMTLTDELIKKCLL